MLRTVFFTLLLAVASACAQTPPADGESDRGQQPSRLTKDLLGVWVPYGEAYRRFGDLTIGPEVLSWGPCLQAKYRVLRIEGKASLIQLLRSPPCKLFGEVNFLVLDSSNEGLEVSICREEAQLDRPLADGRCSSWGVLYQQKRSLAVTALSGIQGNSRTSFRVHSYLANR